MVLWITLLWGAFLWITPAAARRRTGPRRAPAGTPATGAGVGAVTGVVVRPPAAHHPGAVLRAQLLRQSQQIRQKNE